MTRLETRVAEASDRNTTTFLAVVTAVAAALALATGSLTSSPSLVPRLTVVNPTLYQVEVGVRGQGREGVLELGGVRREVTRDVEEVLEQGDHWVFHFSYGGQEAGDLVLSRDELQRGGWRITIPAEVGERLRRDGFQPSAR